ncbi:Muskelin, partial [Dictyocoela muelleri]
TTLSDIDQFIILELDEPAIVTEITFRKFSKLHVCNVKYLKVYSLCDCNDQFNNNSQFYKDCNNEFNNDCNKEFNNNKSKENKNSNLIVPKCINIRSINKKKSCIKNRIIVNPNNKNFIQTLRTTLSNDSLTETFSLKTITRNKVIISNYIKITPLVSWGMGSTFSFWYIELHGFKANFEIFDWNKMITDIIIKRLVTKYLLKQNNEKVVNEFSSNFNNEPNNNFNIEPYNELNSNDKNELNSNDKNELNSNDKINNTPTNIESNNYGCETLIEKVLKINSYS